MATNAQRIQGEWNYLCDQARAARSQLTEDDLRVQEQNIEQLIGRIQQKTGEGREAIETFFSEMTARLIGGRTGGRGRRPVRPSGQRSGPGTVR